MFKFIFNNYIKKLNIVVVIASNLEESLVNIFQEYTRDSFSKFKFDIYCLYKNSVNQIPNFQEIIRIFKTLEYNLNIK